MDCLFKMYGATSFIGGSWNKISNCPKVYEINLVEHPALFLLTPGFSFEIVLAPTEDGGHRAFVNSMVTISQLVAKKKLEQQQYSRHLLLCQLHIIMQRNDILI